jgi:site-specific DNA recombinase
MSTQHSGKRIVGVVRVSERGKRDADNLHSPNTQRERIEREDGSVVAVYDEIDVSGGKPLAQRPGLRRAVEAVEAGKADVIVVAYFDRLVRSLATQAEVIERVERAGGDIVALDLGKVTNGGATVRLTTNMLGAITQYQREQTGEKSREAQIVAVERGTWIAPRVPVGYVKGKDGRLTPSDDAPLVREAFALRADGATLGDVLAHLAARGLALSYAAVQRMFGNPAYLGEIRFGRGGVDRHGQDRPEPLVNRAAHPAIIDRDVFARVERVAKRTSERVGRRAESERLLARTGILRCSGCGRAMSANTGHFGTWPIYRCSAHAGDQCKRRMTIDADAAERVVVLAARELLDGQVAIRAAQKRLRNARRDHEEASAALSRASAAMVKLAALGVPDNDPAAVEAAGQVEQLRQERDDAADRLAALDVPADDDGLAFLGEDFDRLSLRDKRRAIKSVIARAVVEPVAGYRDPDARVRVEPHGYDAWSVPQVRTLDD